MLQAGFERVCITPSAGASLAGFAARKGVCSGVHDDLFVRALVLANDSSAVAIVSIDVLALPGEFVNRVRRAIAARVPIGASSLMVACTHTHAAPVTIRTFFNPDESVDPRYIERLAAAIENAVAGAWENRFDARVGHGSGRVAGIGVNRRNPAGGPVDEEVGIIRVADVSGKTRGVLVNYACHPTVLGPDNLLATGDFPNMAVARIEAALGPDSFAMYTNGAQGDISMGHSSELSAIGVIAPGRTFEHATELGHRLADAVLSVLPEVELRDSFELGALVLEVKLPLKRYPPAEETAKALAEAEEKVRSLESAGDASAEYRRARSELLYCSITDFYARETARYADGLLPIGLQGLRIHDALFVAVPGELFVEVALSAKQSARVPLFVVGLANGYVGYLPCREAYEGGGYEVVSAKCGPDFPERLLEAIQQLEQRLIP
ncbi:MAG TPA: neutral/alkaline non-lysosomal ceramidase N-terminal domain-containing protein [Bryobacteraceae bacterium]|nr:neutral/alkaline non-lysosomal ceramidase N-terminal domain-containing protein [Bryobacteraceae bacterium]